MRSMRWTAAFGVVLAAAVAAAPARAGDTTKVDVAWMVTASGRQSFDWTANAVSPPPQCGDRPDGPARDVTGNGSFALTFSTPRAYRMATVQVVRRAGRKRIERSLSYRPRGAPKVQDSAQLRVPVSITGTFTDAIKSCFADQASTTTAPADRCGAQQAALTLTWSFGVVGSRTLDNADLDGRLGKPWYLDGTESHCPTYTSAALKYFDTSSCDVLALHAPDGPPETGLAKYFNRGHFYPRLIAARPQPFVLTVDKPIDCTLGPTTEGFLPPVAAGGTLRITGALHYVWTFTPRKVSGRAARPQPL
jgi:hypothetical protein